MSEPNWGPGFIEACFGKNSASPVQGATRAAELLSVSDAVDIQRAAEMLYVAGETELSNRLAAIAQKANGGNQ